MHRGASIQRIVSPLTKDVSYRAQVRVKGRSSEAATFPNRKEAEAWAASIETAIREGRHFPHTAAKRTSFDALAKDYAETVLVEFDEVQRAARTLQLNWWSKQFAGKSVAEITAEVLDPETGKPQLDAPYEHFDAHWYAALEAAGDQRLSIPRPAPHHGLDARPAGLLSRSDAPRSAMRSRSFSITIQALASDAVLRRRTTAPCA